MNRENHVVLGKYFLNTVILVYFVVYLKKWLHYFPGGQRAGISLSNILQFATCDEEVPLLGYENGKQPSTTFYEVPDNKNFIPTANTCVGNLKLPRPSHETPLPVDEELFEKYDLAFVNAFFGHK